jgi:hypothetical protein
MASDNARAQNNKDFQLSELFNVKDKVALITGMSTYLNHSLLLLMGIRRRLGHWFDVRSGPGC